MHKKEHKEKGTDKVNHPKKGEFSKVDRREFDKLRKEYWRREYEKRE